MRSHKPEDHALLGARYAVALKDVRFQGSYNEHKNMIAACLLQLNVLGSQLQYRICCNTLRIRHQLLQEIGRKIEHVASIAQLRLICKMSSAGCWLLLLLS